MSFSVVKNNNVFSKEIGETNFVALFNLAAINAIILTNININA